MVCAPGAWCRQWQWVQAARMPCESCGVQFSVFRRKRACSECSRLYCGACLRRGGGLGGGLCGPCRALTSRPLQRAAIAHLKPRDLQCFLQRQNVSTRGIVEKEELVSLCVSHVNSATYRRRGTGGAGPARGAGGGGGGGPLGALRGLGTNINDLLTSAFDLRTSAPQTQEHNASGCYNSAHAHYTSNAAPEPVRERFTTRPGGQPDVIVAPPPPCAAVPRSWSLGSCRRDTDDCFEVEDLDDAGWELLAAPADPLPNDSEILMTSAEEALQDQNRRSQAEPGPARPDRISEEPSLENNAREPEDSARNHARESRNLRAESRNLEDASGGTPQRAASELDLNHSGASAAETTSLKDEPLMDHQPTESAGHVTLEGLGSERALEALSVKQLKELLARNRVQYRGCIERAELLARATSLYRDHTKYRDEIDKLPLEECCKICMAAPLECVLLECGHMAACTRCAKQLAECPICRQYVVRAVRVFRS